MGGLFFAVYATSKHTGIGKDFVDAFMNIKSRGTGSTEFITETSSDARRFKNQMSKNDYINHNRYTFMYGYHRSVINDTTHNASQPFIDPAQYKFATYPELRTRPQRKLMCNGEIYNYQDIITTESFGDKDLQSVSDVEVILPLYIKYGLAETLDRCIGEFALVITENTSAVKEGDMQVFVARDQLGIRPLYMIQNTQKTFFLFVSELKAVPAYCTGKDWETIVFPPATFWSFAERLDEAPFTSYYNTRTTYTYTDPVPAVLSDVYTRIRVTLISSVARRVPASGKIGVLLSDGFNSSLLLSILSRQSSVSEIHAFSFGTATGKDCVAQARQFCSVKHYNIRDDLLELPSRYETYVPPGYMGEFLLLKAAKENDIKVVLYGGFLDVLFNTDQDNTVAIDKLESLHLNELKHLDAISGRFDVELRYPYLDLEFVDLAMSIHPRLKARQMYNIARPSISKYLVRRSFNDGYLSASLLWKMPESLVCNYTESLY